MSPDELKQDQAYMHSKDYLKPEKAQHVNVI